MLNGQFSLGYMILMFGFRKKVFQPFVLFEINGTNFVRGKNLVSFCSGHRQMIVLVGIHDIDALVFRKKHFNTSFCWDSTG